MKQRQADQQRPAVQSASCLVTGRGLNSPCTRLRAPRIRGGAIYLCALAIVSEHAKVLTTLPPSSGAFRDEISQMGRISRCQTCTLMTVLVQAIWDASSVDKIEPRSQAPAQRFIACSTEKQPNTHRPRNKARQSDVGSLSRTHLWSLGHVATCIYSLTYSPMYMHDCTVSATLLLS